MDADNQPEYDFEPEELYGEATPSQDSQTGEWYVIAPSGEKVWVG